MCKLHAELSRIQGLISAPKNQLNAYAKYKFRSCEDILTAVKPLLGGLVLTLSDDIKRIESNDITYIEATARISNGDKSIECKAQAGIENQASNKKMMDLAQSFGSSSSYARKYALCGLLCIDDSSPDPDATNTHGMGRPAVKKTGDFPKPPASFQINQDSYVTQKEFDNCRCGKRKEKKFPKCYGCNTGNK